MRIAARSPLACWHTSLAPIARQPVCTNRQRCPDKMGSCCPASEATASAHPASFGCLGCVVLLHFVPQRRQLPPPPLALNPLPVMLAPLHNVGYQHIRVVPVRADDLVNCPLQNIRREVSAVPDPYPGVRLVSERRHRRRQDGKQLVDLRFRGRFHLRGQTVHGLLNHRHCRLIRYVHVVRIVRRPPHQRSEQ